MGTGEYSSAVGNTVLLIGVGAVGCELAARCTAAPLRRLLSFDADALASYPGIETVCLAGEPENTGDMDTDAMEESAVDAALRIVESTRPSNGVALILCAVGGQTGSIVIPALANELKATQCTVVVVALEPLSFEGPNRAELASRAVASLENVADLVLVLPNRPLAELCEPGWPVAKAIASLKDRTVEAVDQLTRALSCASCVGLQPSDLRHSLSEAGRGALGIGVGAGDSRVEQAIRDACAHSFLTQESCKQASAAILHLLGSSDLSLREVHAATELIGQIVGRVPIQVGLSMDRSMGEEIRATLLVTGVRHLSADGATEGRSATVPQSQDLAFFDGVNLDIPAFLRRKPAPQIH